MKRHLLPRSCVTMRKVGQYKWEVYERNEGKTVAIIRSVRKREFTWRLVGTTVDHSGCTTVGSALANVRGSL